MMDEFTRHLMAKRDPQAAEWAKYEAQLRADPVLAAAHAKVNERAAELRPHGLAIIELLNALAIAAGCVQGPHQREQTQFSLLWNAARVLGVADRDLALCTGRLHGQPDEDFPVSFSFDEMLGGK